MSLYISGKRDLVGDSSLKTQMNGWASEAGSGGKGNQKTQDDEEHIVKENKGGKKESTMENHKNTTVKNCANCKCLHFIAVRNNISSELSSRNRCCVSAIFSISLKMGELTAVCN